MNTNSAFRRGRVTRALGLLGACLCLARCGDDGPTAPDGATTLNVSGSWSGRYRPGIGRNFDPCDSGGPVSASFAQEGSRVRATFTAQTRSFAEGDFVGELHGSQLLGTLTSGARSAALGGTVSASRMTLSLDLPFCSSNSIELQR